MPLRWLLLVLGLAAAGCSRDGDAEAMLLDYVERVARVAEVELPDRDRYAAALLAYPDRRDRRLPLADLRIGVLDFLALLDCGMQEIVGERNSGLGKVMPVSRQLVYEHRLLVSARRCRRQLDGDGTDSDEMRRKLDEVVAVKTADLPRAYWNATFGSPEFEHMFSLAAPALAAGPVDRATGGVEQALAYLADLGAHLGDPSLALDSTALEAHYQTLASRRMAGELLRALDLLRFYLDGAARAIESRLAAKPVCYQRRPTPRARIFATVFHKFYAGRVQPYLSVVHRQARDWLSLVNRLADSQRRQMTPAFRAYFEAQLSMASERALWVGYERAHRRHTRAWQELLGQCGLMPGRS